MMKTLALVSMAAGTASACADDQNSAFEVWIDVQRQDHVLIVTPSCRSTVARDVTYRFVSSKAGRSGTSRSAQSGQVSVNADADHALAHLSLGISDRDSYRLDLDVYEGDKLLGSASASYPPAP